jgi:hypothetical protein
MMDGEMEPPELKTVDEARGDGGKSSRGIGPEVVRAEIEIIEFEAAGFGFDKLYPSDTPG